MTLPDTVSSAVEGALRRMGLGQRVTSATPVGGGCINNGARIENESGSTFFLKWNPSAPGEMFAAEADGLSALCAAGVLRVPEPLAWSECGERPPWLLMEYVASGRVAAETDARLAEGLAALHGAADRSDGFGWHRDNWIGSLPQANSPAPRWADFWRDERIAPQLEAARASGRATHPDFDRLLELIPRALGDVERPELLHGDLWGGNWFAAARGEPVLIDPAVYRGDGEVDIAMSELFGGFGPGFYATYDERRGLGPEYRAYRRDLYQLYYLLVHVNLFGASYEGRSRAAARRVIAELA